MARDISGGRSPTGIKRGPGQRLSENDIGKDKIPANNASLLRRQRCAQRAWRWGRRTVFEVLDHIAREFNLECAVDHLLDRFAPLDLDVVRALGGDKFRATPLRAIGGGQ